MVTLENLFMLLNDHLNLKLINSNEQELGYYDSKNSIDPKYNTCEVLYIDLVESKTLLVQIKED